MAATLLLGASGLAGATLIEAPASANVVVVRLDKSLASGDEYSCAISLDTSVTCWGRNASGQLGTGGTTSTDSPVSVNLGSAGAAALSASDSTTCGLTRAGRLYCWGANAFGQLGTGSTAASSSTPTSPTGMTTGVVDVDVSAYHACAVKDDATLWCWGSNTNNLLRLGGAVTSSNVPVQLESGVASVAVELDHVCFTRTNGTTACWGLGTDGKLGYGSTASSTTAKDVGLSGVRALALTEQASCALTTANAVWCWGKGTENGTGANTTVPVQLTGLGTNVRSISASSNGTCAVKDDGTLWCWGQPHYLDRSGTSATTPVQVSGLGDPVVTASTGTEHLCAVDGSGVARCLGDPGYRNRTFYGALGTGSPTPMGSFGVGTPTLVPGFETGVTSMAVGATHTCAAVSGEVKCVGAGTNFGVGQNPTSSAVTITGLGTSPVVRDAGDGTTCVSSSLGLQCWGKGTSGQLGNGASVDSGAPVTVTGYGAGVASPTYLSLGGASACLVPAGTTGTTRQIWCWGNNANGQLMLGVAGNKNVPTVVSTSSYANSPAMGSDHSCFTYFWFLSSTTNESRVRCGGNNSLGALGNGTTTSTNAYTTVTNLPSGGSGSIIPYVDAVGGNHSCAASSSLTAMRCWGDNLKGQLGNGATSGFAPAPTTVAMTNTAGWEQPVATADSTCAIARTTGNVYCWGDNTTGIVKNFFTTAYATPQLVLSGATALSADPSGSTVCALKNDGLWCWGRAADGQMGSVLTPRTVVTSKVFQHGPVGAAPTITATRTPAANVDGWAMQAVTVSFTCAGGTGALTCPTSQVFGEGAGQQASGTVTAGDGQTASTSLTGINVDLTQPNASAVPAIPPPIEGWYDGDVPLVWTCTDNLSGVAACPTDSVITGEGHNQTATVTVVDRAGNARSVMSDRVRIDRTAPTTTASTVPAWSKGAVSVHLTGSDGTGSGVASTEYSLDGSDPVQGTDVTVTGDGQHVLTYRSTDRLGHVEEWRSVTVRIDGTAPTISATADPEPNEAGWNSSDVTVTFTCDDGTSGVASCTEPVTVADEGIAQVDGSVSDAAGNSGSATHPVRIDRTAPTIAAVVPAADGDDGWYRSPVTIGWDCSDALSGVASCDPPVTLAADGAGQTASGGAEDLAGNTASATADGIDVDTTAPIITTTVTPPAGPDGQRQRPVTVHFDCSDATSGVRSCPADEVVTVAGTTVVTGVAVDVAGNEATTSVSVTIAASPVQLVSSADPSVWGQSVSLRATSALGTTGTMRFYDGATLLATKSMSGGAAILTTAKLTVGSHQLTVTWQKSSTAPVVTSDPLDQVVTAAPTETVVTSTVGEPVFGQSVSIRAKVSTVAPGAGVPTGTVDLYDGATYVGSKLLSSGAASFTVKAPVGDHHYVATYQGSPTSLGSSGALDQTVDQAATKVTITSPFPTTTLGHSGNITAAVAAIAPGTGVPTGSVAFYDGGALVATASLVSGKATMKISLLARGVHELTAVYLGSPSYAGSASSPFVQTIT